MPATQAEVVAAVKTAAQHCVPLYPISRGKSWGYGDACPVTAGNVILDLSRMNRIREVDPALAYAVIEPGVTQGQLSEHLRAQGIALWPRSEEHTSELQSLMRISYAVFCSNNKHKHNTYTV